MSDTLRRAAEAAAQSGGPQAAEFETPEAASLALHELRVHQIELQMQNEELRRAHVELDLARSRYFDLYDLAPTGYFTLSAPGVILQVNLTAVTMLGATRNVVLGRAFYRCIHEGDQGALHSLLRRLDESGERQSVELRVRREDRSVFWAQLVVTTARNESGALEQRVMMSDVTARKEAELARREGEERFRDLFARASEGIILCGLRGVVVESNAAFAQLHGLTTEELVGRNLRDLEKVAVALTPARLFKMARGEVLTFEVEHLHRDGHSFFLEASTSEVTFGGVKHVLGLYRDITQRKQLQESLAQNDRLTSMGMLAAGVAHEINNPLVYVLSNLERLTEELPRAVTRLAAGEDGAPLLDELIESARGALEGALRIKKISRALGSFSRVERDTLERVDLNRALESAATMAHNELKYRAQLVKSLSEVPRVLASEGKVTQVFLNLLINAAHAIEEGHASDHRITMSTWATATEVFAEIADTGRGITPENLTRIFEPFFTTKPAGAGSGLGLSICRTIMKDLGGELRVESVPGKGSRFLARFPVAPPESAQPAASPVALLSPARGKILVVDDEPAIRSVMQRVLGRENDVVAAGSGTEAMEIIKSGAPFDVILCDLMMPEMTGMELHAWLVAQAPELARRVIFVSGGAFTPNASAYLASVSNPQLQKPFEPAELKKVVGRVVTTSGEAACYRRPDQ